MPNRLPLLALSLSYLMVIMDALIVNVALPAIGHDLHGGTAALQWTVDAYTIVFAALLLPAGALGDRLGSRRVFELGLLWFAFTSAACAAAPSLAALIALRALQGAGAAALVPSSLALLRAIYHDPSARARAIGVWGTASGIGAAGGPVLGGVLVGLLSWRWVFLVNVPVGIVVLGLARTRIRAEGEREGGGIDPLGQLAAIVTLALLVFGVIEAGHAGIGSVIALLPLLAVIPMGAGFLAIEHRGEQPMLPLHLFRSPALSGATAVGFAINFGVYGQLFVFSLYFQHVLGYSALHAGLALLPEGVGLVLSTRLSGTLTARVGPRPSVLIGLSIGAIALGALTVAGDRPAYGVLIGPLALIGFGMGFAMPAATAAVISAVPARQAGLAAAILNASRQVGSAAGVALLGALVAGGAFTERLQVAVVVAAATYALALVTAVVLIDRPVRAGLPSLST